MAMRRSLRGQCTRQADQVKRQIEWMKTRPATFTMANGLPAWWPYCAQQLKVDVRELVLAARLVEPDAVK